MQIHEQLWAEAAAALAHGHPQIDRHLTELVNGRRRGVSLIFRPSADVQASIQVLLDELAAEFPGQYFIDRKNFTRPR